MIKPLLVSYLLAALAVWVVLYFHLLSAVFAGLAVYVLTVKLASHLPTSWGRKGHGVALAGIFLFVVLIVSGVALGLWLFVQGHEGVAAILGQVSDRLESLKQSLPPYLSSRVPDSVEELRGHLATLLREHGKNISHVGMSGARSIVHVLVGMVIGGMAVLHRLKAGDEHPPLAAGLQARLHALAASFERIVFAQLKIASLNTFLTAIYLLAILPLCGEHLPMSSALILLTFVAGLLPVVGNLVSNSVILLISLGVSPGVAIGSLVFLLLIHKLEYFLNAKIVGGEVDARSWELLSAMLVMEAIFGISGLIAAPVVYAWLKSELRAEGLV
jgi:predicted PurR-regulated permease PerM